MHKRTPSRKGTQVQVIIFPVRELISSSRYPSAIKCYVYRKLHTGSSDRIGKVGARAADLFSQLSGRLPIKEWVAFMSARNLVICFEFRSSLQCAIKLMNEVLVRRSAELAYRSRRG
jgi:hypothetical protein